MPPPRRVADALQRRRDVAVAGHVGDLVLSLAHLNDPDPGVRAIALGAVHRSGGLTSGHLQAGLADADPAVRCRGLELIAALTGQGPAADVALLPLLDDPEDVVVETAAWAAGERMPPEFGTVARLAELATGAEDALIREAAVAALGSLGDEAALPAILAATTDKATVRRRAVLALAPFEGDEVDAAFERARDDRDWQVRQAAEDLTDPR